MARTMYASVLREWNWTKIREEAERSEPFSDSGFDEDAIRATWLGTTFGIMPSGKFYMPWSSNVTQREADRDERYMAALEKAADKFGGFIFWNDDSCFFGIHVDKNDIEEDSERMAA